MAVERIAHILAIGHAFDDTIFLAELLYLQTAEALRRRSVDCIQISVCFFEFIDLLVDMLHHFQSKLSVFYQGLSVIQHLQFVQSRDAKRCRCIFEQRFDLVMQSEMSV